MELKDIKSVYFVGAGGIGMSALVRYFIHRGVVVGGYDKTPSTLTRQLEKEGALIHYEENVDEIPHACRRPDSCLVVYTPAIPEDHQEMKYFHFLLILLLFLQAQVRIRKFLLQSNQSGLFCCLQ